MTYSCAVIHIFAKIVFFFCLASDLEVARWLLARMKIDRVVGIEKSY